MRFRLMAGVTALVLVASVLAAMWWNESEKRTAVEHERDDLREQLARITRERRSPEPAHAGSASETRSTSGPEVEQSTPEPPAHLVTRVEGAGEFARARSFDLATTWAAGLNAQPDDVWQVATAIALLPDEEALRLFKEVAALLADADARRNFAAACFTGFKSDELRLEVIDSLLADPDPFVREQGVGLMGTITLADLGEGSDGFAEWRAKNRGRPLVDLAQDAVRKFLEQARSLSGDELVAFADRAYRVATAWHTVERRSDLARTMRDGGIVALVETWFEIPDERLHEAAGRWLSAARVDVRMLLAWNELGGVRASVAVDALAGREMEQGDIGTLIDAEDVVYRNLALSKLYSVQFDDAFVRERLRPLALESLQSAPAIARSIAQGLGRKGAPAATVDLLTEMLLKTPPSTQLFSPLAYSLANLDDKRAIPALIAVVVADPSDSTGNWVRHPLARLAGVSATPKHDAAWWRDWWAKNHERFPSASAVLPEVDWSGG